MRHQSFILTPLEELLSETMASFSLYRGKPDNYVFKEYVLQTLFLRMTGAMEQKAKCILWDISTYDFEYRRSYLDDYKGFGEHSNYGSKKEVYKALLSQISRTELADTAREKLVNKLKALKKELESSILMDWLPREIRDFKVGEQFKPTSFGCNSGLLESTLQDVYQGLYEQRNRCAHNLLSYQGNVRPLSKMSRGKDSGNYISWFCLLILIDWIYIELYREFVEKYSFHIP